MVDHIAEHDQALASLADILAKKPKQFVIFYENEDALSVTIFAETAFLAVIPQVVMEKMMEYHDGDIEI